MNGLTAIVEFLEFVYSALMSYAKTPEGQVHLSKLEDALGMNSGNSLNINSAPVSSSEMPSYTAQQKTSQ